MNENTQESIIEPESRRKPKAIIFRFFLLSVALLISGWFYIKVVLKNNDSGSSVMGISVAPGSINAPTPQEVPKDLPPTQAATAGTADTSYGQIAGPIRPQVVNTIVPTMTPTPQPSPIPTATTAPNTPTPTPTNIPTPSSVTPTSSSPSLTPTNSSTPSATLAPFPTITPSLTPTKS